MQGFPCNAFRIRMIDDHTLLKTPHRMPWLVLPLFQFLIRYRRTAIGPLWLLVGPSLFITLLGHLYASIGAAEAARFIPHMTVGYVLWTLILSFVQQAPTIFQRNRAQILQGGLSLQSIIAVDIVTWILGFLHLLPIIVAVFLIYDLRLHWSALESLVGLAIIVANGLWVTRLFGVLGARYRDLSEICQAVMRIAFLATPIVWMPGKGMASGAIGAFLIFNPFYHFIEIVRAPLLGQPVAVLSWIMVAVISAFGYVLAEIVTRRYARYVPLWI